MPSPVKQSLKDSFGNWVRVVNDPAFRFKSGKVQRTFDDRSLTLGLMHYLALTPATVEALLRDSNAVRAEKLLEQLEFRTVAEDRLPAWCKPWAYWLAYHCHEVSCFQLTRAKPDASLASRLYDRLVATDGRVCTDIAEQACQHVPRNFLRLVGANTLTKIGDELANPKTTLAWLLNAVQAPVFLIGLLVPIRESGSMLPQVFLASRLQRLESAQVALGGRQSDPGQCGYQPWGPRCI